MNRIVNPTLAILCALGSFVNLGPELAKGAGFTTYNSQPTLLAAAGPLGFESFEGLTPSNNVGTVETLTLADFAMVHSGPTDGAFDSLTAFDTLTQGQFPTHGKQWVYARTDQGAPFAESINFDFEFSINAIGFSITDALDVTTGEFEMRFSNDVGDSVAIVTGRKSNGTESYFGIITERMFSHVELRNGLTQDGYGIDAVSYGVAVPEPSSLLLVRFFPHSCLSPRADYVRTLVDFIELLPPTMIVDRISGDAPPDYFIGPTWCLDKPAVKAAVLAEFERRGTWQGRNSDGPVML